MSSDANNRPPGARPKIKSSDRSNWRAPDMRSANGSQERSWRGPNAPNATSADRSNWRAPDMRNPNRSQERSWREPQTTSADRWNWRDNIMSNANRSQERAWRGPKATSADRWNWRDNDLRNAIGSQERSWRAPTSTQASITQERKPYRPPHLRDASVNSAPFPTENHETRFNKRGGQSPQHREGSEQRASFPTGSNEASFNRQGGQPPHRTGVFVNNVSSPSESHQTRCNWRDQSAQNINSKQHEDSSNTRAPRGRGRDGPTNTSSERARDRNRGRARHLDVKCLMDMLDNGIDPTEIVMELATERSGWKEFLERKSILRDIVVLLLAVMAKACLCTDSPRNLNSFLAVICQSGFLSQHLSSFISSLSSLGSNATELSAEELKPSRNIISLLQTLLRCVPTFALDEVAVNVTVLEIVCKKTDNIPEDIKEEIKQLKGICDDLQQNREGIRDNEMARAQYKPPPDDFRGIDIIPQTEEVRNIKRPLLSRNLIKGQYQNTEHYLDVQFRLLREDFVAPLREGVGEYLENIGDFQKHPRKRLQDVRLYHGVQIKRPIMTHDGTGHLIQFDTSPFQKIRWESSKRLINGSLLCLTEDDFQTVIFATVVGRDIWQLQRGEIQVRFIRLQDVIHKSSDATFMMAETSAYFESYRHVLEGLKVYNDNNLPMKSYIVEASNQAKPPAYLDIFGDSKPMYDLRITSQRMSINEEDQLDSASGQNANNYSDTDFHDDDSMESFPVLREANIESDSNTRDMRVHNYVQRRLRAVNILEPGSWPEANILYFDESQLEAFRAALSSEFVLIQGPPGTGKTYVGLEIVKALLFNCHAWCHEDSNDSDSDSSEDFDFRPILVVCYTNHALDQFLEGIYHSEKDIVRVGGRCKTKNLEDCCISNIRASRRRGRLVPDHIHRRRADMTRYYEIKDILDAAHERMTLASSGLVDAWTLYRKQIMTTEHYRRLLSSNHGNPIFLWLVGRNGEGLPTKRMPKNKTAAANGHSGDEEEKELLDIAEEAALLADQRELGNDPTFLMDRDESHVNVATDFAFIPRNCVTGESRKEMIDRQRMERAIEHCFNSTDPMSEEEASEIRNIWELTHHDRWRLYCCWAKRYINIQQDMMLRYQVAYERLAEERREIDREEDYLILREAKVIGFTTTGAAKHRALLQRVRPRITVVEEAAEVLEAHIITTLSQDCQHVILIGDHQQLRPKPTVYRLEKQFNLGVSLFERMINNGVPCHRLGQQHRMRPEISILMKEHFYDGLEDHSSVNNYPSVKGVTKNLFFVEHDHNELNIEDNSSKSNLHEATFLVEFCYYLLQQGYSPSQITILTTYTGQLFNFKQLMSRGKFEDQRGNKVRVSVVDNFQGEENDIILLSLVRSNDDGSIGFLKVHNRVCVALSRAKMGLYCIGNIRLLAEKSDLWKQILKTATEAKQIGPKIPLVCQIHPDTMTELSCPEDFLKRVPDGGCSLQCEARLDCGHACRLYCHPKDPNHEEYRCMKDCNTECDRGHKCTLRCYQECQCQILIRKLFAKCQHTGMVKCHEDETAICKKPCTKRLPCNRHDCPSKCGEECPDMCTFPCPKKIDKCGHQCVLKCGMPCMTYMQCKVEVKVKQPKCIHSYIVKCKNDPKWTSLGSHRPCYEACARTLKCGHQCDKVCHEPCQTECKERVPKTWSTCEHEEEMTCHDAMAAVCQMPCEKLMKCGHRCMNECSEVCDPSQCQLPCGRPLSCGHPCKKKCNETCDVTSCESPCKRLLPCSHQCKKICNEPCDVTACDEVCTKFLACDHPCQNRCNEPCETCCNRIMLKALPCGHHTELSCSTDVKNTICLKPCLKNLECGHRCQRSCDYPCTTICKVGVVKELPGCKHKTNLPCAVDPNTVKCSKPCEKVLQCKHKCIETCGSPCTKQCRMKVRKQHPKCGHYLSIMCHEDVAGMTCREPCQEKMPCNHKCPKMCYEPCKTVADASAEHHQEENNTFLGLYKSMLQTFQTPSATWPICKAHVHKTAICGHQLECLCCDDPDSIQCHSPCTKKLTCGHPCPGTCSTRCDTMTCRVTVSKHVPGCEHLIDIECHKDPASIICQERCARELACGHLCSKLCSEPCSTPGDLCRKRVVRSLFECGHQKRLECHEDPDKAQCENICKKKLPCGHPCLKTCHPSWELCETNCRVRAHKKITQCGHFVKLPCHLNPDSGPYCEKACKNQLECGHECKEKCGRPCTTKCKETKGVQKMLPCDHVAREVECYMDPQDVVCHEQCTGRLSCGHDCKEVCGECRHRDGRPEGTVSRCGEVCFKRLICGHQCRSKCSDCCGGRLHQPCRTRVDDIALLCGCKSRGKQCSKLLYLRHGGNRQDCLLSYDGLRGHDGSRHECKHTASGEYCDESCTKLLRCKHTCIGICGEPCIDLCRFCNRRKVLKIYPEFQAETDPCYIQLKECKHIFEVNELKRKLGIVSQTDEPAPIRPITCPKCGRVISEGRFNDHSSMVAKSAQAVERNLNQQASSYEEKAGELLSGSNYTLMIRSVTQNMYGHVRGRSLFRQRTVRQEVRRKGEAHMIWKLKLLNTFDNILPSRGRSYRSGDQEELGSRCEEMIRECVNGIKKLLESILDEKIFLTEQLAEDVGCELDRLQWSAGLEKVSRFSREFGFGNVWSSIAKAVDIVTSPRPFTIRRRLEAVEVLGAKLHSFLEEIIQQELHTELQREDIIEMQRKELGFLAGDWFKCPRDPNHVFQYRHSSSRKSASVESVPSCPMCRRSMTLL